MPRLKVLLTFLILLAILGACADPPEQPGPFDVVEATIGDIQQALLSGRTTCREIVQSYLDRIEAYDKDKGLNAITVLNPKALIEAGRIDEALAAGSELGPLFCAPLLVKDNFDTFDLPTTGGSIALKESRPPDDAFMVRKIRQADAIIIAKTNMAEWAFSPRQTVSSSYGVTANAYALDRVPAGSSGGTASGVAASFGVAGLGTDTGNSIRGPSSHLALFGIRSTIGLTSRDGVIPLAFDRDIAGPLARTVEDAVKVFNVVAGYDPNDPFTEPDKAEKDYSKYLDREALKGARLGVLRALVDTEGADPAIGELFAGALSDMKAAGAEIVDPVRIEGFNDHIADRGFCPRFRYDMHVYLESLGEAAPIRDVIEVLKSGQFSPHVKSGLEFFAKKPADVAPRDWDEPCLPYLENPRRKAFLEAVTAAMDEAGVEVLLYPTWTHPPAHLDKAREEYKGDNSQLVAPATGMPAASVPMGFSKEGLPAGLQILARRFDEGAIFKIAYAYEQATLHRRPPEGFPGIGPPSETGTSSRTDEDRARVAVTVDDLVYTGSKLFSDAERTTRLLVSALSRHQVPASGFVNGSRVLVQGEDERRLDLLRDWRDAGVRLENHSFSHRSYHRLPRGEYLDDALRGQLVPEMIMGETGGRVTYYRHPFNHTGTSLEAKYAFEEFLGMRRLKLAPFTVEHADYAFNALYTKARQQGDSSGQARIGEAYLAQLDTAFDFAEGISQDTFGRRIPQIFLIHANDINADYLDRMLARLSERGYRFVSLDEAMRDPAYGGKEEYVGATGISWFHRWRMSLAKTDRSRIEPDPPRWIIDGYRELQGGE